jgi:hypothetical protein
MAAMNVLRPTVAVADAATNSAGAACLPSTPHYNEPIGVPDTPTNAPSSAAPCPDDANDNALLIDDDHSAITEGTHVSLITEDSMLNTRPLPVAEEVASSWDGAENLESISRIDSPSVVLSVLPETMRPILTPQTQ